MIVLDASALVELLLNTTQGAALANRIRDPSVTLHAPHLVDLEVAQTLRRYVRTGEIEGSRARLALEYLSALDLDRYPHVNLLPRIWALRHNVSAYDAAYVSLAEALNAVLVTGDRHLAGAPGIGIDIELLA